MTTQESNVNVPNGFVSWEEVVGETIKLATSSLGIGAGLVGIVAAPVAVALIDKAVSAYKEQAARDAFKAEELAFRQAERDAEAARKKAEKDAAERAFEEARIAAESGDSQKAAKLLGEAAAGGSPEALYALAMSLLKAEKPDYRLAEKTLRIASDAGIEDATLQLALLLYRNATSWDRTWMPWRDHPNRKEYIKLVKKLADEENLEGINLYAIELVNDGNLVELERLIDQAFTPSSLKNFFVSIRQKPIEGLRLYYLSTYTDIPEKDKIKRLKLCAKNGYLPALNNLALMYKKSDPDECRRLLMEAARKGNEASLKNLVSTDRERFGDEGAINRYIALIEKKDEVGVFALAHMCVVKQSDARKVIRTFWEQGNEQRFSVDRPDGTVDQVSIDELGGTTAVIVGDFARIASFRGKPFAKFLLARAEELGYVGPQRKNTAIVYESAQKKTKDPKDPFAGVGRNDPCPCGSGKKFKKCHGMPKG